MLPEFQHSGFLLFSSPVHPSSSVAALCHPKPLILCSGKLVPSLPSQLFYGVSPLLVNFARLLSRSGCGLVTVFEQLSHSAHWLRSSTKAHFYPLSYSHFLYVKSAHGVHSVPTFPSFHTLVKNPISIFKNSSPLSSVEVRQALVHTA